MKFRPIFGQLATALACSGLLAPRGAIAANPAPPPNTASAANPAAKALASNESAVVDVALGVNGTLIGSVVDAAGQPRAGLKLRVMRQAETVAESTSDRNGNFRINGLSGGVHEIAAADCASVYRLWADKTAPPGAAQRALLVADPTIIRGQRPLESLLCVDPLLVGAIVATAIAVPVIVHNTRHDRNSGS